jgi:hypothetical protein
MGLLDTLLAQWVNDAEITPVPSSSTIPPVPDREPKNIALRVGEDVVDRLTVALEEDRPRPFLDSAQRLKMTSAANKSC